MGWRATLTRRAGVTMQFEAAVEDLAVYKQSKGENVLQDEYTPRALSLSLSVQLEHVHEHGDVREG